MERLFTQQERPLSAIAHAAVAVRSIDSAQRHIGVLHREGGIGPKRLPTQQRQQNIRQRSRSSYPSASSCLKNWLLPPMSGIEASRNPKLLCPSSTNAHSRPRTVRRT
jgi:hypothetical protein